jgi:hypothetical protein
MMLLSIDVQSHKSIANQLNEGVNLHNFYIYYFFFFDAKMITNFVNIII